MNVAIFSLTSSLHDEQAVSQLSEEFLHNLGIEYDWRSSDFSDYGSCPLSLIYVRTGGTEGLFRTLLPSLLEKSHHPFYLLASGKSNSLAASMEILSFLRQKGYMGEILHGRVEDLSHRICLLEKVQVARKRLSGARLGIIGKPSDWLIASVADAKAVQERMGVQLVDIPINKLINIIESTPTLPAENTSSIPVVMEALPGAERIYRALREIVASEKLDGLTLRCFDLLTAVHNTGCLALAQLNAEGITAGCEGDVPTMLSMMMALALTGSTGFQANPSTVDVSFGEVLFAHCTIPLNMVSSYEFDTHFESGIGVGIRGFMNEGPVTVFKLSGDLSDFFVAEGELVRCQSKPDLCRTQLVVRLDETDAASYFLTRPIGNHHVVLSGHHKCLIDEMMKNCCANNTAAHMFFRRT